jgi:hypothetical protein
MGDGEIYLAIAKTLKGRRWNNDVPIYDNSKKSVVQQQETSH